MKTKDYASLLAVAVGLGACSSTAFPVRSISDASSPAPGAITKSGDSYLQAGRELLGQNQPALAIGEFRKSLLREDHDAQAANGLAVAYDRVGRPDLAERYFEMAMGLDPDNQSYGKNFANFLMVHGRKDEAEVFLASMNMRPPLQAKAEIVELADASPVNSETIAPAASSRDVEAANVLLTDADRLALQQLVYGDIPAVPLAELELPSEERERSDKTNIQAPRRLLADRSGAGHASKVAFAATAVKDAAEAVAVRQTSLPLPFEPKLPQPREMTLPTAAPATRRDERNRLERLSLFEVMLVTEHRQSTQEIKSSSNGKIRQSDFARFEQQLADWLPAAIDAERGAALHLASRNDSQDGESGTSLALLEKKEENSDSRRFAALANRWQPLLDRFAYTHFHDEPDR